MVLEGLVAVDEDDRDFIGKAAAKLVVRFHVNFAPGKSAAALQFRQRFLDDFAKMANFAGIKSDLAEAVHGRSLAGLIVREKGVGSTQLARRDRYLAQLGARLLEKGTTREKRLRKSGKSLSLNVLIPSLKILQSTHAEDGNSKVLSNKTVLITGGARRLGRAIALAMAEAGADVAITFRNSSLEAQHTVIDVGIWRRAVAMRCDITEEKSVRTAIKEMAKESGGWISWSTMRLITKRRIRQVHGQAVGRHLRLQHSRAVSGFARSSAASAGTEGKNHQPGVIGRMRPWAIMRIIVLRRRRCTC